MEGIALAQKRENTTLVADGKELVFENGVCKVEKITKDIQALVDANYIEEIQEDGKAISK